MIFIRSRWSKILKDIWGNKSRSLLVILSIAVGVAAVGMITNAGRIIQRDLDLAYASGNPSLLEIYVSPFDKELATSIEGMREVEEAQARRIVSATILHEGQQWEKLTLNVVPDFNDFQVSKPLPVSGNAIPGIREILLETDSAKALNLSVGDTVSVEMPDERRYDLTYAGSLHDVYVQPFSLLSEATGYISMETLKWMGLPAYYNRLDIIVSEDPTNKDHVIEVGNLIRNRMIEPSGYQVGRIQIPGIGSDPGEHWAHNQIKGFLLILQIMGIMAVLLSGGLVINTISAIINQQIKQIGIMRSVGSTRVQIIGMYLVNVLVFSILGLMIAIPLGLLGAWWLVNFAAGFLNFNATQIDLPFNVLALQVGLGLLMPIVVALFPIISGTKISVYDAIYQYGLNQKEEGGRIEKWLSKFRSFSPPVMISFRNTFRKKGRLAFTLITLTLAGAMFVAVFSTRSSLTVQIKQVNRYLFYDAAINVPGGENKHTIEREALRVSGVNVAEGWASAIGIVELPDGSESEELEIIGLPHDTATIKPLLLEGTWLKTAGADQVVVNDDLLDEEPGMRVGSQIVLKVGEKKRTYQVVGVVSKHLSGPRIYLDEKAFSKLTDRSNRADMVRVLASPDVLASPEVQDAIAEQLEERFQNAGLSSSKSTTQYSFFGKFTDVFDIILVVLIVMAGLLAIVGGLGLTGTMGMNVIERTREIGVLRAVGASNIAVRKVVVIEGIVVGLISWLLGAFLSGPTGQLLAGAVIDAVLKAELSYRYSFFGLLIWLVIVILIGIFSSLAPARKAVQLRVREVLDYE
jgi:putative ABC transport system permease protein